MHFCNILRMYALPAQGAADLQSEIYVSSVYHYPLGFTVAFSPSSCCAWAMLSPTITSRLIGRFAQRLAVDTDTSRRLEQLSERERGVLVEIARGHSNSEISERLFISAATVKSHINHVFTKLGVRDRAQAVAFAYESGLVEPGETAI